MGAKNTLTARYGFWSESEMGNLSAGSLPSASTHESNTEHTVQMSDSYVINDHMVNETRFQYRAAEREPLPRFRGPHRHRDGRFYRGWL